jgi:hypothetical protein
MDVVTAGVVYDAPVAPTMSVNVPPDASGLLRHWYVRPPPVAVAVNVTVLPDVVVTTPLTAAGRDVTDRPLTDAAVTVSDATLLVTLPAGFDTTTYTATGDAAKSASVATVENDAAVAPLTATPPLYHWYVSDGPVAVTENVRDDRTAVEPPTGCTVIAGGGTSTVSTASVDGVEPATLVTTQRMVMGDAVTSAAVVVNEYDVVVAPVTATPDLYHWYDSVVPGPVAAMVKAAVEPWNTVCVSGCVEMTGGCSTVSVATLLVADPILLVTVTV